MALFLLFYPALAFESPPGQVEVYSFIIVEKLSRPTASYIQGFDFEPEGSIIESLGQYG
jgi:glutamine cyclotransferase